MNSQKLLLYLLLLNIINSNFLSNNYKEKHSSLLRALWEEDMEIPSGKSDEEESSLKRCAKSSYKYFTHVLSGTPVSFEHSITDSGYLR